MGAKPSISEDRLLSLTDSCLCHGKSYHKIPRHLSIYLMLISFHNLALKNNDRETTRHTPDNL